MSDNLKKVIIATGGTGGHVFPAYALAMHLKNKKINREIFSDKRGLEYLKNLKDIKKVKIFSSPIKKGLLNLSITSILIILGIIKSLFLLLLKKPDIVFGMGGYSSFPVCFAAKILKVPFVIYENNICIGKTNKFLLPYAKKILVAFSEIEGIPENHKIKISVIGNIVRKEFLNFKDNSNLIEGKKISFLILGGSQAAKVFGETLPIIFKNCLSNEISLKIYQQCLPEQNQKLKEFYEKLHIEYEIFNFTDDLLKYFSKTNLTITRSGSSMLAELMNTCTPFICVPLPTSAEDHQLKNAIHYEKKGCCFLIEERFLSSELLDLIMKINKNRSLIEEIRHKQSQHSDKLVYENIDKELKI